MPFSILFSYFGLWVAWNALVYVSPPGWDVLWSVLTVVITLGLSAWGFILDWHRVRIPASYPSAVRARLHDARIRGARLVRRDDEVRGG